MNMWQSCDTVRTLCTACDHSAMIRRARNESVIVSNRWNVLPFLVLRSAMFWFVPATKECAVTSYFQVACLSMSKSTTVTVDWATTEPHVSYTRGTYLGYDTCSDIRRASSECPLDVNVINWIECASNVQWMCIECALKLHWMYIECVLNVCSICFLCYCQNSIYAHTLPVFLILFTEVNRRG